MRYFFGFCLIFLLTASAFFVIENKIVVAAEDTSTQTEQQEYVLLAPLPGLENRNIDNITLGEYVSYLYTLSIGLASVLAVLMLVYAGFQYMVSDVPGVKTTARESMINVFLGLFLILTAYLLLNTINPELVSLKFQPSGVSAEAESLSLEGLEVEFGDPRDPIDVITTPTVFTMGGNTNIQKFATQSDCEEERQAIINQFSGNVDPGASELPLCKEVQNPVVSTDVSLPVFHKSMIRINQGSQRMHQKASGNPFRDYNEFAAGKGTRGLVFSIYVIQADAYISKGMSQKYSKIPAINSAYRDDIDAKRVGGTTSNHPYGYSIDYSVSGFTSEMKKDFERLALASGAKRIGFAGSFAHVQWNGTKGSFTTGTNQYYCYASQNGPYSGKPVPGWVTFGSHSDYHCSI